jgi:hypothetical protein
VGATVEEAIVVTDPNRADDEKAPPQVLPNKPQPANSADDSSPSDQPPGEPQHEPANPDDDG